MGPTQLEEEGGVVIVQNPIVDTYMEDEEEGEGIRRGEAQQSTFELEGKEAYIIANTSYDD